MNVRATQGRVKKSIFDVLAGVIEYKTVIDMFAGYGNLGIEALKRGAEKAVFIEKDRMACSVIRKNLKTMKIDKRADVWAMDAFRALPVLKKRGFSFDLFFADPPYDYRDTESFMEKFFTSGIAEKDAIGVVEHSYRLVLTDYYGFKKWKEKRFGETMLSFYRGEEN